MWKLNTRQPMATSGNRLNIENKILLGRSMASIRQVEAIRTWSMQRQQTKKCSQSFGVFVCLSVCLSDFSDFNLNDKLRKMLFLSNFPELKEENCRSVHTTRTEHARSLALCIQQQQKTQNIWKQKKTKQIYIRYTKLQMFLSKYVGSNNPYQFS